MAGGSPPERTPALRASDGDRERAVVVLREGAAHGRLTFDELAHRTELAYGATTQADLETLVADLPQAAVVPAAAGAARKRRRWNIALLGGCERAGRWRPAPRSVALAILGGVDLDLRDATIDGEELVLTAVAVLGGVEIVVPDGVELIVDDFALFGRNDCEQGTEHVRPGGPVIRVRAVSVFGGVDVRVKRGGAPRLVPGDT